MAKNVLASSPRYSSCVVGLAGSSGLVLGILLGYKLCTIISLFPAQTLITKYQAQPSQ